MQFNKLKLKLELQKLFELFTIIDNLDLCLLIPNFQSAAFQRLFGNR